MTQPLREFAPIRLPPLPDRPRISVLLRNYNHAAYVGMALQSVLNQTYQNWEAIVCDDGSTDTSRQVIQEYLKKDPRVKLVAQPNAGPTVAANTAYENCKGELIAWLDADDVFRPCKLEKVLAAFRANPLCGLYADPVQPISKAGKPVGHGFPDQPIQGWLGPQALREGGRNVLPPMSGLSFRREITSLLFPIPTEVKRLEDYYIAATALFLTEVTLAPDSFTEYRIHEANRSGLRSNMAISCLSAFDARVHTNFVERLEGVVPFQRDFLHRFYGSDVAETLRVEDNPRYWDLLLGIRVLAGKRNGFVRPFSEQQMIDHVSATTEKRLWRVLLGLPRPVARRAYRFWRNPSRLKVIIRAAVLPVIKR
jgi:glycosyltransferase involved in cell wall biosynthesis